MALERSRRPQAPQPSSGIYRCPQATSAFLRRPGRSSAAAWVRRCLARAGSPPTGRAAPRTRRRR
eukprot:scaffold30469_cov87-Phaeocystis_antarctica.AAC.1